MVTYYSGPSAVVTTTVFDVQHPYRHAFVVNELRDVAVARGGADSLTVGSTCLGGAAAIVVVVSSPLIHGSTGWLGAALLVTLPLAIGLMRWRLFPPASQLWATYRGERIMLFTCTDARIFGQVSRALQRALEARAFA